jgi:hypothetical protein
MIDNGQKITFTFLQYYGPKNFFLEKYQYGYQKNAEFYADFKFAMFFNAMLIAAITVRLYRDEKENKDLI